MRRSTSLGALVAVAVVLLMAGSYVAAPGAGTSVGAAGTPFGSSLLSGVSSHVATVGGASSSSPSSGLSVASQPNGKCGLSTWCKPVTGSVEFFSSSLAANSGPAATRTCLVALSTSGACTSANGASTSVTPYLNATNDVALNYTSTGTLAMAYTNYTTVAPTGAPTCSPARPAITSEVSFQTSSNQGQTWTKPIEIGTSDCANATKYPSSYDPALTSLGNGTLVLAYVEYAASAPNIPPTINAASPPVSRLVLTELYPGSSTWTSPTQLNVSKPDPSLTVSFSPARPSLGAWGKTIYVSWMSLGSPKSPQVVSHVVFEISSNGGKTWSPTITLGSGSVFSGNPNVLVAPVTGKLYIAYATSVNYCGYQVGCSASGSTGEPYTASVAVASSTSNGTSFTTVTAASGIYANQTFGIFYNPAPQLSLGSSGAVDLAFIGGVSVKGLNHGVALAGAAIAPDLFFYTSSNGGSSFTAETASQSAIFQPTAQWGGLSNSTQLLSIGMVPAFGKSLALEATMFNGSACVDGDCGVELTVVLNTSNNGGTWSAPWIISGAATTNGTSGNWRAYWTGEYEAAVQVGGSNVYIWPSASCPSWNPAKPVAALECGTFNGPYGTPVWTLPGTSSLEESTVYTGAGVSETFTAAQTVPANATWGVDVMGKYFAANGSANVTVTDVPTGVPVMFNASAPGVWQEGYLFNLPVASVVSPATFTTGGGQDKITYNEEISVTIHQTPGYLAGENCYAEYEGCPQFAPPPGPSYGAWTGSSQTYGWTGLNPYSCLYNYCYNAPAGASTTTANLYCTSYIDPYIYNDTGYLFEQLEEFLGNGCSNAYVAQMSSPTSGVAIANLTYNTPIWTKIGTPFTLAPGYWSPQNVLCGENGAWPTLPWATSTAYPTEVFYEYYCYENYFIELQPQAWIGNGSGSVTTLAQQITFTPQGPINETVAWNVSGYCDGSYEYGYSYILSGTTYGPYTYNDTPCYSGNPFLGSSGSSGGLDLPLTVSESGLPSGTEWGLALTGGSSPITATTTLSTKSFSLETGNTYTVNALTIPIPKTGQYWVGTPSQSTVTVPNFNGITVSFAIKSLSGFTFNGVVSAYGLPKGVGWTLSVDDLTSGVTTKYLAPPGPTSTAPVTVAMPGGSQYEFNGTTVTTSTGVEYYVQSVNATIDSINGTSSAQPPWLEKVTAAGSMQVNITYAPAFYVTVQSNEGGTVSGTSSFVDAGKAFALTAVPSSGYQFFEWVGSQNGSVTSSARTITVHPENPMTELAVFRPIAAPTWTVTVQEVGLPVGQNYSLSIDGVAHSGVGTFNVTNVTNGDHVLTALPTFALPAVNIEYAPTSMSTSFPSGSGGSVTIDVSGTVTVTYAPAYELTLTNTTGGSISGGTNGEWLTPGANYTLVAEASPGYAFVSWNGTGSGSYTGTSASASITALGPLTEQAQFLKLPPPTTPTYTLTVAETGLPSGAVWNATVGLVGGGSSSSTLGITGLTGGTYTLTVPIVYAAAGVRYVPENVSTGAYTHPEDVVSNVTATVAFTKQYLVTVLTSGNGTASESTGWITAGTSYTVTATAGAPPGQVWKFANWTATGGAVNTSAAQYSLTVDGPVTLTATFVPVYTPTTTVNSLEGLPLALGLLIVLLIVGAVVGLMMAGRRRSGGSGGGGGSAKASAKPKPKAAPAAAAPAKAASPPAMTEGDGAGESDWSELNEGSPPS